MPIAKAAPISNLISAQPVAGSPLLARLVEKRGVPPHSPPRCRPTECRPGSPRMRRPQRRHCSNRWPNAPASAAARTPAVPPRVERHPVRVRVRIGGRLEELDYGCVARALGTGSFGSEAHSATRTGHRLPCCKDLEERHRERKRHAELRWIPWKGVEIRGRPGNRVLFRREQPIRDPRPGKVDCSQSREGMHSSPSSSSTYRYR